MNVTSFSNYFLNPDHHRHRQYEALRAVFVDGETMQDVAAEFGVTYGTVRNWVSVFRRTHQAGRDPFFSHPPNEIATHQHRTKRSKFLLPMLTHFRSHRAAD